MPPQRRHLLWARGMLVGVGVAGGGWYLRSHDSVFSKCRVDDAAAAASAAVPPVGGGGGALLTLPPAATAATSAPVGHAVGPLRLWLFRIRVVLRAALLLSQVVPLLWACVLHTASPRLVSEATLHDLMLAFFKGSGPCLLKLGQWAATRPDKFSKDFCEVVGRLHHSVPRHSWRETRAALREAYGGDAAVSALFESVEEVPLHSGCIAQVHRARLRGGVEGEGGGGVDVVLKVMHPGVRDSISLDLAIVRMAVTAVSWVVPRSKWLSLHEMCTEFEVLMLSQLDMRAEARNLARFGSHFAGDATVVVPRANEALTTADVLVETYEEGALLGVWQASEPDAAVRKAVGLKGCRAFLKMVFQDNFYHADMHPGNLLVCLDIFLCFCFVDSFLPAENNTQVREDPTGGGDHKIVLLDAGLVSHLAVRDKRNFVELFAAVCVGDGRLAADLILAGAGGADECASPEAFREGMARIVDTVNLRQAGAFQLSKIQIGRVLLDTMDTVRDNRVRLDPNFTTLIVAIVILEGIGRSLDPDLNIFKVAAPYLLPHVEVWWCFRFDFIFVPPLFVFLYFITLRRHPASASLLLL